METPVFRGSFLFGGIMSRNSVNRNQSRHQHVFSLVPEVNAQRSSFNKSFGHKTTFNEGYLIPCFLEEVLPGDTFNVNMHAVVRMATPIYPIMDNLYFETQFWFVPNRLVWEHWQQFCGAQLLGPSDSTDYVVPQLVSAGTGFVTNSLADYFGIPTKTASGALSVNALPFRAYNLIYAQWYADQNLQTAPIIQIDDGPDTLANYSVLQRGKRHDYFTSCLPWPQKINDGTVVEIPLGVSAPVIGDGNSSHFAEWVGNSSTAVGVLSPLTTTASPAVQLAHVGGASSFTMGESITLSSSANSGMIADLTTATAATINQLRQAFQLQTLFERDARGGTRYPEVIKSHFNVHLPDMQWRPEYLGGSSQRINVNAVAQTAPSDVSGTGEQLSPQGNLAAFAVGHITGHGFTKSFAEHGHVIGICSVRADLNYMQGLDRMWSRSTRYDFYWPALAHIGEQAVLNQEIYAQGTSNDTEVFGYQERFAEYRFKNSIVSSYFRSNATGTLDAWHLAQAFGSLPSLNSTFIVENAPMSRVEAVSNVADFIADMYFQYHSARVMPLYGTPMSLGRF